MNLCLDEILCACQQRALNKVVFPIGNLKKAEVKQLAIDAGFADVAAKKEVYTDNLHHSNAVFCLYQSMGLCFVGPRKFSNFIKEVHKAELVN